MSAPEPADTGPRRLSVGTLGLAAAIVLLDQVTKAAVRASIPEHASRTIIPNLLDLTHVRNSGTAFGFMNAVDLPHKAAVLALVQAAALVAIAFFAAGLSPRQRLARLGLVLIIGGAAGNLVDRMTVGSVVDFVDVYWRDYHFWAFNVADSAITIGVIGMMLDMLGVGHREDAPTGA